MRSRECDTRCCGRVHIDWLSWTLPRWVYCGRSTRARGRARTRARARREAREVEPGRRSFGGASARELRAPPSARLSAPSSLHETRRGKRFGRRVHAGPLPRERRQGFLTIPTPSSHARPPSLKPILPHAVGSRGAARGARRGLDRSTAATTRLREIRRGDRRDQDRRRALRLQRVDARRARGIAARGPAALRARRRRCFPAITRGDDARGVAARGLLLLCARSSAAACSGDRRPDPREAETCTTTPLRSTASGSSMTRVRCFH